MISSDVEVALLNYFLLSKNLTINHSATYGFMVM